MKIDLLQGADELLGLSPSLESAGLLPAPSLAADPGYLAAGHEGPVPCAMVAREGEHPIAYMPFVPRWSSYTLRVGPMRLGALPYRQLRLLGYRGPDDDQGTILGRLCEELARYAQGRYHVAMASELVEGDPLPVRLAQQFGARGGRVEIKTFDSFRVDLGGTFTKYQRRRFSSKTRNTIRRKLRAFADENGGDDRFELCTAVDQVDSFLNRAEAIARRSYQWRQGHHVARSTTAMRSRLAYLAERGCFRGYLLSAGSTPVAYCIGSVYGGKFDYEVPGFDERFSRLSPGIVLLDRILADLFEAQVADHLDFGAGPGEYKRMFATTNPRVVYLSYYPRRAYSILINQLDAACHLATTFGRRVASRCLAMRTAALQTAEPA
jgi:hypothetical protein